MFHLYFQQSWAKPLVTCLNRPILIYSLPHFIKYTKLAIRKEGII